MISVVIPTLDAEARLGRCLAALAPAALTGMVREVVVSDGGSKDKTRDIAEAAGAVFIEGPPGRGGQLRRGAAAATKGGRFLFLHADTVLDPSWPEEVAGLDENAAYVFRLRFDAKGRMPRLIAAGAMLRTRIMASPYGDQGLMISRSLYDEIGGYRDMPLFEDVDIVDRVLRARGRLALKVLRSAATTSAERYERGGYLRRIAKNFVCLSMYRAGRDPADIAAYYRS